MQLLKALLLPFLIILTKIQISYQQSNSNCQLNPITCCDDSCSSCSQDLISKCTRCKSSYFYFGKQYQCLQKCPKGTYQINSTKQCIQCQNQNCSLCSETACLECKPGFTIDPQNPQNCISVCSKQNMIQDDQGECSYGCQDEANYSIDYNTHQCVEKFACPKLTRIPELVSKSDIVSTLLNYQQNLMTSIDQLGNVILYSYPDLIEQVGYSLPINTTSVAQCTFINDDYIKNDIISCLLSPIFVIQFYNQNGTVISQNSINDRTYLLSFSSRNSWNLFLAYKDKYELQYIDYFKMKKFTIDTFNSNNFQAVMIQREVPISTLETMVLNLNDKKIYYYQIDRQIKIETFTTQFTDPSTRIIQLYQYQYWIIYSGTNYQLLRFDFSLITMSLLQNSFFEDKINAIYIQNNYYIIFVIGTLSFNMKLVYLDASENSTQILESNLNDQLSRVNFIYQSSNIIIVCSQTNNINAYQLTPKFNQLKYLMKLKESNQNICSLSTFKINQYNQTIHIQQIIQRNIGLNIYDIQKDKMLSQRFIGQFADSNQVRVKLSQRTQYNYVLVENIQKQLIVEFKNLGLVYQYDTLKKNIVNQIRFWYPYSEATSSLYFNSVVMIDPVYLFAGIEFNTVKIKIINIKTYEISYEQEFPQISIPIDDLSFVLNPAYFPASDSIIIQFLRKKLATDSQKRYDFIFIQKNPDLNSQERYKYLTILSTPGFAFLYGISAEVLILFDQIKTQFYNAWIYRINGEMVYKLSPYTHKDVNRFGLINESQQKAYIFQQAQLLALDLQTMIESKQASGSNTMILNQDFTIYCTQGLGPTNIYNFPSLTTRIQSAIQNQYNFVYQWYGQYLSFKTYSVNLFLYDSQNGTTGKFFTSTSIHGINNGSMVQDSQVVFFNSQAISHYDISTQQLLYVENSIVPYVYILQTTKFRNNYVISNQQNIFQVKKYNENLLTTFQTSSTTYYICYIPEVNFIIILSGNSIKIYNSITSNLIQSLSYKLSSFLGSRQNFATQEIFARKGFYYQPSNIIVLIYYLYLICLDASTLKIFDYTTPTEAFKSIHIDLEFGYLISTNLDKDCIFNMNTLTRKCYKEVESYQGLPNQPLADYTQELFMNQNTKTIIICQMTSIRLFSIKELSYVGSVYSTSFDAAQFFYNPYYNYVIFSQQQNLTFSLFDLNTMSKKFLNLPSPSKDFQATNYRFQFLSDKSNYIFLNYVFPAVFIYNQLTHELINKIQLDINFYQYSSWVVDEQRKYIFIIDANNTVQHISYDTNKILYKYQVNIFSKYFVLLKLFINQLNSNDTGGIQKNMVWDNYKQKLLISSQQTFYVIGVAKNMIEFYYYELSSFIEFQFILEMNQFYFSTFQSCIIIDYDYFVNDNKDIFPNQIYPRHFKVNNNTIFHLNDINSIATLFKNEKFNSNWIRNNLRTGYIRIVENDLQNQLVYAIFDNEIVILDTNGDDMVQIDQVFISQNIIGVLHEDQNHIFLHSQSQQILVIQKKQRLITLSVAIKLSQGIAQHIFTSDSMNILFTDYLQNTNINIVSFNSVNGQIVGRIKTPIPTPSVIVDFKLISDSLVVILLEQALIIYDIIQMNIIQQVQISYIISFGNIRVDLAYNRIFIQNKYTGSLIFDLTLKQSSQNKINTFSTNFHFDEYFIYSINGHSANIYFRKDLKFLFNFRHFDMTFSLKKITYLGVGYIFLVEFLTKLSIYELSPLANIPVEIDQIAINQFSIIDYKLQKINDDLNDNKYLFKVTGLSLEGMFTYTFRFDIYNQQSSQSCSWSYPLEEQLYQETNKFNQLSIQFSSQNRQLSSLVVLLANQQNIRLPQVPNDILSNNFDLLMAGIQNKQQIYVLLPLNPLNNISFLKLLNMEISTHPSLINIYVKTSQTPQALEINKQKYPNLKQFAIDNIILNEAQIVIEDVSQITIKNIEFTNKAISDHTLLPSITQLKINKADLVLITSIIIYSCNFNLLNPILDLNNVGYLKIDSITIRNNSYKSLKSILSFQGVQYIEIGYISIIQNIFYESSILFASSVTSLTIQSLTLENTQFEAYKSKKRQMEQKNQDIDLPLFSLHSLDTIKINTINIINFKVDTNYRFLMFSIKNVKNQLTLQLVKMSLLSIDQKQKGIILFIEGVYDIQFISFYIYKIQFLQLIKTQSYKLTKVISSSCNSILTDNITLQNYQISQTPILEFLSYIAEIKNLKFNQIQLNQTNSDQISLFQISASEKLIISNIKIDEILSFTDSAIKINDSLNILIEKSIFQSITCLGSGSVLSLINSSEVQIIDNQFSNNVSFKDTGTIILNNCDKVVLQKNQFLINQSLQGQGGCVYGDGSKFDSIEFNKFDSNISKRGSGGALICKDGSIKSFNSNQFNKNSAINGSGGAVYLNNCDVLQLAHNIFNKNSAFIGGAIRYQILKPLVFMNNQIIYIKKQNSFFKNEYIAYGKDIGSYPIILDVKNSFDDDSQRSISQIMEVQSGYKAQTPILLRLIDEEYREINFVEFKQYPNVMNEIKEEFSQYILQIDSSEIGLLGDLKQGYSQENIAFVFDLQYTYKPSSSSIVKVKSTQNLPQFSTHSQEMVQQQFEISITVNFRQCQSGEVQQKNGIYVLCYTCGQGFYSIENPHTNQDIDCQKCPIGSIDCSGSSILLQDGYWRLGQDSDIIVYCGDNKENCKPEDDYSKNGCSEGHIGPLCIECDVKGAVWGSQFAKTSENNCMNCSEFKTATNITIFIAIFIFILSQIFGKAYKQVIVTKQYIQAVYLSKLGFISPNVERVQTVQASLMKILLNYFQFSMIVNSLDISIPIYFSVFNLSGGDTSQQTINRIDCLIFGFETKLPNYIIHILWVNFQPFFLFLCLELLSQFTIQRTQVSAQKQTLYTNLIIVFSFYQPSITKVLSQSISCKKIGNQSYILSDLNEKCLTEDHMYYFYRVIFPLGISWIILGPLFLFQRMRFYQKQMNNIKTIYRYGYLYQEFHRQHYYWDILRMFIRSFAIISINVLNFQVLFKGLIILGLIYYYQRLSNQKMPYLLQKFNILDRESCQIVIYTLYLLYIGYLSDNQIIYFFMIVLIGFINGRFVLKMLQLIFIKPINPNENLRNVFQKFLVGLKLRLPYLFAWIEISNTDKTKAFMNWKKVYQIFISIKQANKESQYFNRTSAYQKIMEFSKFKATQSIKLLDSKRPLKRKSILKQENENVFQLKIKSSDNKNYFILNQKTLNTLNTEQ